MTLVHPTAARGEREQAIDEQGCSPADEHPRPGRQTTWYLWAARVTTPVRALPPGSPYALLALQQRGKHGCFADLGMTGRGEQCQLPVPRKSAQVRQCLGPRWILQLQPVATAEFLEAARVVALPLAKLV